MLEVKYFLEDHWWKLLIGIGVIVLLVFIFGGESEEEQIQETNETGMITDDNYIDKAEDAYNTSEFNKELEEEEQQEIESTEGQGIEKIRAEDVTYDEDTEFELKGDLIGLTEKYDGKAYEEVTNKFEPGDNVLPEGDILRNKSMYAEYGNSYEGCINNNSGYEECVLDILSELKWLSGDMSGDLEKSYNKLGTNLSNQKVALEGMRDSYTGEYDLSEVIKGYELGLFIRGSIVKDLGSLEGMEQSERVEVETKVKTSVMELKELDKFLENFWVQVMENNSSKEE